jgi:alpha-ketoglutarate-dependent taurine dioxygenase
VSAETLTNTYHLADCRIPLVVEPALGELDLVAWMAAQRKYVDDLLTVHGALLLRNFAVGSVDGFQRAIREGCGPLLDYIERSSPRTRVSGMVFTSTDHPADQPIFLHNEQSYNLTFPTRIAFYCELAARAGGETPIADTRNVLRRLSPATLARFHDLGYALVRNYGGGCGLSWRAAFQTDSREVVDEHCRRNDITPEWSGDALRTRQIRHVVARHPRSGALTWFNHATFFHVSTLEQSVRRELEQHFPEELLPNHTYYGDGSPIEPGVMDELREAYLQEQTTFCWQSGDVLLLDNMVVAHGRAPFAGPREVRVAMACPCRWEDVVVRERTAVESVGGALNGAID